MSEFLDPSVPPKKYRTLNGSGTTSATGYSDGACTMQTSTLTNQISGSIQYNKDTCEVTDTGHLLTITNGSTTYDGPFGLYSSGCPSSDVRFIWDCAANSKTVTGTGDCVLFGGVQQICGGNNSYFMSDEDTEDDAIARANASVGDWVALDGGNCLSNSAFIARNDEDFSFTYRSEQTKACASGLVIGDTYTITIRFGSRAVGSSGPFIPNGLTEVTFTATATTDCTGWVDVPNDNNMETIPTGCTVRSGG